MQDAGLIIYIYIYVKLEENWNMFLIRPDALDVVSYA